MRNPTIRSQAFVMPNNRRTLQVGLILISIKGREKKDVSDVLMPK
jgi:hypothetical protein